jgi:hypothetical protein
MLLTSGNGLRADDPKVVSLILTKAPAERTKQQDSLHRSAGTPCTKFW